MRRYLHACVVLVALCVGCAQSTEAAEAPDHEAAPAAPSGELAPVSASHLCVTSGRVDALHDGTLKVDVGTMRGVVAGDFRRSAELAFTYPGPSAADAPLADGTLRRQIGVKLRAQDSCNVVYVMWHIEPTHGIVVSMKHNPGASTHAECGDSGYTTLVPSAATELAHVMPGDSHTLRADLDGDVLTVVADGALAWKGKLPAEASTFDGPAGVRSDNGHFDFRLRVGSAVPSTSARGASSCVAAASE